MVYQVASGHFSPNDISAFLLGWESANYFDPDMRGEQHGNAKGSFRRPPYKEPGYVSWRETFGPHKEPIRKADFFQVQVSIESVAVPS